MKEGTIQILARLALATFVQVWIFHHLVVANGWVSPLFHLYGLVLLPLRMRPFVYLFAGGVVGFAVDIMQIGGGLFTSAGLMTGYLQPLIARLLAPREGYEPEMEAGPQQLGWSWWIIYVLLISASHSIWLFALEAGRWGLLPHAIGQALTSSFATTLLIVVVQALFARNRSRR